MILYTYIIVFTIPAILFILIKSSKQNEPLFKHSVIDNLIPLDKLIKIIPTGAAMIFVLINMNESIYLSTFLAIALLFCLLGDLGMEKGIIPGLPIFLLAQLFFIVSFGGLALEIGINLGALVVVDIIAIILAFYLYFFIKYLNSSEKGLGKLYRPVIVYCIFISGMVLSIVLLWMSSGRIELSIVLFGGILFVISDSTIAVREFHHKIANHVVKVMSTYYLAIFLLSLSSLVNIS